jgi:ABC-type transport system involved in multi-copper enzyme maturation permease subunit
LVGVELFKIRKRRMCWILLGVLILLFCLSFLSYYYVEAGYPPEMRGTSLQFPDAFNFIFSTATGIGTFLLVILASFMMGDEYSWGTIRPTMAKIVVRRQYLGAKVVTLVIIAIIVTMISLALGTILASFTTAKLGELSLDFITLPLLGEIGGLFGGTVFSLTVYALFALLFTTLARAAWWGIGAYIIYGFVEMTITTLSSGGRWLSSISQYLITPNTYALVPLEAADLISSWFPQLYPSIPHAIVVLLIWCILLMALSLYFLQRRDITA